VLAQRATVAYAVVAAQHRALAVVGIPIHNGERHLEEALDSLAAQGPDLRLVAVDDCSDDRSAALLASRSNPSIVLERHERRLGLVEAWRRAFDLAVQEVPSARYFAWGSDHDVWEPGWLDALVSALEANPDAVLAYPLTAAIAEDGSPRKRSVREFETVGVRDPLERMRLANGGMRAGDMVYGLYRIDALRRCGPFPATLLPDRLLLARLALEGEFVQVDRILWRRRYREGIGHSLARQRRSLFGSRRPFASFFPWWASHAIWFLRSLEGDFVARTKTTSAYVVSAVRAVRAERREKRARLRRRRTRAWRTWLAGAARRRSL
jgi:glycosyltransferase involved in cell wall biosynthesis